MKFKVGDRVKYIGVIPKKFIGKIGIIDEVRPPERDFPYSVRFSDICRHFPVLRWEIEPLPQKNQQLLFSFME